MKISLKKTILFFGLITFFTISSFCQDSIGITKRPVFTSASLFYNFPESFGLTAGINTPFTSIINNKVYSNGRILSKQKDFFLSAELGFYRYPFNYTGLCLFPSIGTATTKNLHYHEFAFGVGLLRTVYDGTVYKVDANGNVLEQPFFGRFYATANFSYAIGWQFRKTSLSKFAVQLKPQLWFQFPYDSFIKPNISLEVSIKYHFRDVSIRTSIRTKKVSK